MDDHLVTEDDLSANFLIPHDESMYGGRSRADVCCQSLKDFNPMVRVDVAKGEVYSLVQFLLVRMLDWRTIYCIKSLCLVFSTCLLSLLRDGFFQNYWQECSVRFFTHNAAIIAEVRARKII